MVARARLVILTITIKYRYSLFLQAWFTNSTFRRKEVPYTINGVKPLEGHIYLNTSSDHTSTYFRGDTRKGEKMRLCIINTKARQTKRGFWIRRRFSRLALGGMLKLAGVWGKCVVDGTPIYHISSCTSNLKRKKDPIRDRNSIQFNQS